jgi:hypothetical protein
MHCSIVFFEEHKINGTARFKKVPPNLTMFDYIPLPDAGADFTDTDDDGKIVHDIIPTDIPSDIEQLFENQHLLLLRDI